jgi:EmrB/QacA subfamily drug resistance transporter
MALGALEATVVGAAMPTIVAALGGLEHYSWVFSIYLLASTVTVPLWGKLSDLYGRKPIYQGGVALFLLGSVLCGGAQSMGQLVAARAIQGIGAGALIPLAMTILADIYTLAQRARMQAVFSGVWGVSSVLGPVLGGVLTEHASWRWVFLVNVPVGIAAALILQLALVEPPRDRRPKIDWAGAATLTAALTLLLLGMESMTGGTGARLTCVGAALFFGALFLFIERRTPHPLVPLELFRNRVMSVAVAVGILVGAGMFGALSFVPLFAQGALGASAGEAGRTLTPLMLGWVSFSVVGGRLLLKFSPRPMVLTGCALLAAGLGMLSLFGPESPRFLLTVDLVIIGAGLGLSMLTLLLSVQQSVPRPQLGLATALNQLARSVGGAVGVALMGALLASGLAARVGPGTDLAALLAPRVARAGSAAATAAQRRAFTETLHRIFRIAAGLAMGGFVVAAVFLPKASTISCSAGAGERLLAAEGATLDAEHEPEAV